VIGTAKATGERAGAPVVFVIGIAGAGKSTIARQLAAGLRGVYLDKDTVAGSFTGQILESAGHERGDRDSDFYRNVVMPLEYETLLSIGEDNMRLGHPVIFDAPFGAYFSDREYIRRRATEKSWPAGRRIVLRVQVNKERNRQQLSQRTSPRDAWKLEHWDEFWASAQRDCLWEDVEHITVDNTADSDVAGVIKAIAA
jgi:predicted kinase